jgi:Rad3-related DNA helicase
MVGMLDRHSKKDNSVMISAGTSTGLDLKDDLARFQIIVKMPYPSLGDKQIKRRFELTPEYYSYLTALTLMQTYGRGIRHEEDFAATYILDSDFGRFLHFNKKMLSEWFLEAIVEE